MADAALKRRSSTVFFGFVVPMLRKPRRMGRASVVVALALSGSSRTIWVVVFNGTTESRALPVLAAAFAPDDESLQPTVGRGPSKVHALSLGRAGFGTLVLGGETR